MVKNRMFVLGVFLAVSGWGLHYGSKPKFSSPDQVENEKSQKFDRSKVDEMRRDETQKRPVRRVNRLPRSTFQTPNGSISQEPLKDWEIALNSEIEQHYPAILSSYGFDNREIEIIVDFTVTERPGYGTNELNAIEKSVRELNLSEERRVLLRRAYADMFLNASSFSFSDIKTCMDQRLDDKNVCAQSVLDDFLNKLSDQMAQDRFQLSIEVANLANFSKNRLINECGETLEKSSYQFRLVFVECQNFNKM